MTYFQSMLVMSSQNATLAQSCPSTATNKVICKSSCNAAIFSLKELFSNPSICSSANPSDTRTNEITQLSSFCANLAPDVQPLGTNCLVAVQSESSLCGFASVKEAVAFCSVGGDGNALVKDTCCMNPVIASMIAPLSPTNSNTTMTDIIQKTSHALKIAIPVSLSILALVVLYFWIRHERLKKRKAEQERLALIEEGLKSRITIRHNSFGHYSMTSSSSSESNTKSLVSRDGSASGESIASSLPRPERALTRKQSTKNESTTIVYMKVIKDYTARASNELPLVKNNIIKMTAFLKPGWGYGVEESSGLRGIFPLDATEKMEVSIKRRKASLNIK
jgi:hypothetical protein